MADSTVTYAGDGSTNLWTVTFPYLSKSHVHLYIDGVEDLTYTWVTDSSIAATSTPASLAEVTIKRITPRTSLVFSFGNSGTFRGSDLNNQALQALYVATEGFDALVTVFNLDPDDNKWDAESYPIKNIADPTNAQDAATKTYVDAVAGSATAAAASASAASASQSAAAASASAAASSASAASTSETNAAASAASIGNITASGARFDCTPYTDVTGVTEVGKYIDFHDTDGDTGDYAARLYSNGATIRTPGDFIVDSNLYVNYDADANYYFGHDGSDNPRWIADSDDYIVYDRTANQWSLRANGTTRELNGEYSSASSGTAFSGVGNVDITVPSWANEFDFEFLDVSNSTTSTISLLLGTSGSFATSGYTSTIWNNNNTTWYSTAEAHVGVNLVNSDVWSGVFRWRYYDTTRWFGQVLAADRIAYKNRMGFSQIQLGSALTRIRFQTATGTFSGNYRVWFR